MTETVRRRGRTGSRVLRISISLSTVIYKDTKKYYSFVSSVLWRARRAFGTVNNLFQFVRISSSMARFVSVSETDRE